MVRSLPPLNALRAFEAAARLGGFARAAEELNVTPAAVSQQVRALELRLGARLFARSPAGVALSEDGRAFLPTLSDAFERLAQADEAMRERRTRGRLTVSALSAFAAGWLVPRLPDLRQRLPNVDLVLRSERHLVDFARDEVDLAIRFGPAPGRGLTAHRLMGESVSPVCSPALAHGPRPLRRFADLAGAPLLHDIDAHPAQPWMSWTAWFARERLPAAEAQRGLFFNDALVLLAAAIDGQGVALGREPHLGEHLARGRLVRPFDRSWRSEWSYWVVGPPAQFRRPPVRAFVDWLLAQGSDA
jgi:LysR family glycine cleavage system transcriptional activator